MSQKQRRQRKRDEQQTAVSYLPAVQEEEATGWNFELNEAESSQDDDPDYSSPFNTFVATPKNILYEEVDSQPTQMFQEDLQFSNFFDDQDYGEGHLNHVLDLLLGDKPDLANQEEIDFANIEQAARTQHSPPKPHKSIEQHQFWARKF